MCGARYDALYCVERVLRNLEIPKTPGGLFSGLVGFFFSPCIDLGDWKRVSLSLLAREERIVGGIEDGFQIDSRGGDRQIQVYSSLARPDITSSVPGSYACRIAIDVHTICIIHSWKICFLVRKCQLKFVLNI